MNTVGIITAMEIEMEKLALALSGVERKLVGRREFITGELGGKRVVLAVSGIGKVNAASCCQTMIDRFAPDAVLMTGIAGGLQAGLRHLSAVIGTGFCYHDIDPVLYGKYFPFTTEFPADPDLSERLFELAGEGAVRGKMASGDMFVGTSEQKDKIKKALGPVCVDMETGACAHVCYISNVPFAAMKTISDLADDSSTDDYDRFELLAAERAAEILIGAVKSL